MGGLMTYLVFLIPPMLLGFWAQKSVTNNYARFAEVPAGSGLTGAETARRILDANGLRDVPIEPVAGELSDHYDPRGRVVRLSEGVYAGRSVSAGAIAAHEVGHAIQDARGYLPMKARAAIFPLVNFSQRVWFLVFIAGALLGLAGLVGLGLLLYAVAVLFHIVTLPVEFDASRRAKAQLRDLGIVGVQGGDGTSKVLNAAAMTYVAGALAAVSMLAYYGYMFLGGRN
jgi:Zn-dependent membrane protease YugP